MKFTSDWKSKPCNVTFICLSIYVTKISFGVWNYDTANLSKKPSLQRKYIFSKLRWCALTVSCPEDKYFLSICPGGNFWSKTKWCVWKIPFYPFTNSFSHIIRYKAYLISIIYLDSDLMSQSVDANMLRNNLNERYEPLTILK